MTYSASDFESDVRGMLDKAGFTFHEGEDESDENLYGRFWYAWCGPDGEWDVETGENWPTEAEAEADALAHYLEFLTDPDADGKPPSPVPLLLSALRAAWDALQSAPENPHDDWAAPAMDAIERALDETGLTLPDAEPDGNATPPIVIDGREYDYLTCEWRAPNGVCVHGWGTYPESSVLAGQASKTFIDSFPTMEEALAKYPQASPSHPLLQPQVSLNHLPDDGDY